MNSFVQDYPLSLKQYPGIELRDMPDNKTIIILIRDPDRNHIIFPNGKDEVENVNRINVCIGKLNQKCDGKPTPPLPELRWTYPV